MIEQSTCWPLTQSLGGGLDYSDSLSNLYRRDCSFTWEQWGGWYLHSVNYFWVLVSSVLTEQYTCWPLTQSLGGGLNYSDSLSNLYRRDCSILFNDMRTVVDWYLHSVNYFWVLVSSVLTDQYTCWPLTQSLGGGLDYSDSLSNSYGKDCSFTWEQWWAGIDSASTTTGSW
jgi:hypothetical protein